MEEEKKKKSWVMPVEGAYIKFDEGLEKINKADDNKKSAQKTINEADHIIATTRDELCKIYKANRDKLPNKFQRVLGLIGSRIAPRKVYILKGFSDKIIGILEGLRKESLIRRTLIISLKASRKKMGKIVPLIEEILKKEKGINDIKININVELNKEKILKNPSRVKDVTGMKIVKKRIFYILPAGLEEVPDKLKKEF